MRACVPRPYLDGVKVAKCSLKAALAKKVGAARKTFPQISIFATAFASVFYTLLPYAEVVLGNHFNDDIIEHLRGTWSPLHYVRLDAEGGKRRRTDI